MENRLASFARTAAAASLALCPLPAMAQGLPAASNAIYFSTGKSEAILGGSPSRLAAIVSRQTGQPQPATISPASYGFGTYRAAMPAYRPAVASDRPDVFGTVALPISRTPLDRRWRATRASAGGASTPRLNGLDAMARIDAVNRYVNARVRFIDDIRQFGVADRWQSAADTLRRGRGDCEDYAIAKLELLRRAGFADEDLYLVILRDLTRRADHAVLVVRAEGRLWVLDNGTDRIADSADINDYRPIMTFSGRQAWTHGYRRAVPPMTVARAPVPTVTVAAASVPVVAPAGY